MRLGVLDVGSNTVHLLVVDAHEGARPLPAYSHKAELRLADHIEDGNRLTRQGAEQLRAFVSGALQIAEDKGVEELLSFATSAIRDAVNGDEVLARIQAETDVRIGVLSGEDESRLTFLAGRRWFGWSSGRLLVSRLTRDWFTTDPPPAQEVRQLRKHVRTAIARTAGDVMRYGPADHAVATSKTFRQLARIAGAAPSSEGPYVRRLLSHNKLIPWVDRLASMTVAERVELPGVSAGRAAQMPAGAIVADAAMDLFGVAELEVCPWALREGIILRRLDGMAGELQAASRR